MDQNTVQFNDYYELTDETLKHNGHILHRIRATKDNPEHLVFSGDLGGFVEHKGNLSNSAWVDQDAKVFGNAHATESSLISGNAEVFGNAIVRSSLVDQSAKVFDSAFVENSYVTGNAKVFGNSRVVKFSTVSQNAKVFGKANVSLGSTIDQDAKVFGSALITSGSHISQFSEVSSPQHTCQVSTSVGDSVISLSLYRGQLGLSFVAISATDEDVEVVALPAVLSSDTITEIFKEINVDHADPYRRELGSIYNLFLVRSRTF